MKPLGEVIRRCGLRNHQYADDTQLYLSFSTNPGEAVAVLNRCLAEVMGWMRANKLKLNLDKTEVLLVGRSGFGEGGFDLVLNGVALLLRDRVRSLGVLLDPELSLEAQVTAVARSAFLQLQLIHQLCPFLENDCLATVIHALVTSRLDFCNALYVGLPLKTVRIFQLLQNRAARLLMGTGRCSHITPVLRQLHWLPIGVQAQFKVLVMTYKALNGLGPGYLKERLRPYMPSHPLRSATDALLREPSVNDVRRISLPNFLQISGTKLYYAICCQPLVYRNKMTPLRIALMLGGCWVIPMFISFLPIMQGWNSIGIMDLIEKRQFNNVSNATYCIFMVNKPYAITCSVVAFYIPFLLMVLAYYRIYVTAREHAHQIRILQRAGAPADGRPHHPDQHSTHRMKTETKAAKTLCIIMGCFCLCWAPFFITNVIDPFIHYHVPSQLWTAFLWLGYINSGLNPFLYAFLNKSFRRAFLIILCCGDERYRRPSILGQTVPCSTTTINGSTHVL
ncbi:5-hydroxytryptamine receptor 4, partial [Varanus komodoensis]